MQGGADGPERNGIRHHPVGQACTFVRPLLTLCLNPSFLPLPCSPPQAGKQKGNTAVGRYLAETVAAVPHFTKADFEKMLADQSNDCTLVRGRGHCLLQSAPGL